MTSKLQLLEGPGVYVENLRDVPFIHWNRVREHTCKYFYKNAHLYLELNSETRELLKKVGYVAFRSFNNR